MKEYDKEDFYLYLLISRVEKETIIKVFENYNEGVHGDIIQNIARECSFNRIFILDQAIKFAKIDLASKILTLDIGLDEYYCEHDESVEALEKIIKLFPSHWKSFDASFIFYSMYESIDYWAYDIHSLKALFEPLIKYKIDIEINYTPRTELGFSNLISNDALEFFELIYENTLIDNYKIYGVDFLGCAILESAHKIIHFLISKDFEIKQSHFSLAIEVNIDISVIKKLYRTDFNINRLYKDGNTLLHIAYKNQNMDIVKYLLELNADKTILNNQGRLAMDILKDKG
ncbi:MAG: ankyrin repeat domain-containing protein [Sulfurospirillum sp.]|nr:ankyrin repeat domain-containing protein [Sulfurospirillum sp.]